MRTLSTTERESWLPPLEPVVTNEKGILGGLGHPRLERCHILRITAASFCATNFKRHHFSRQPSSSFSKREILLAGSHRDSVQRRGLRRLHVHRRRRRVRMRLSLRVLRRHGLVVKKVMTRRVSVVHGNGHGFRGRGRQ